MSRFKLRFGTLFLTFTLGLGVNFIFNGLSSIVERWIESPEPVLQEPPIAVLRMQPVVNSRVAHCGLLVVEVGSDHSLWLRGQPMGSLESPGKLLATLNEVFRRRTDARAYNAVSALNADVPTPVLTASVPPAEEIDKTVLIKGSRWTSYGELSDLIDEIRVTGAKPIGLVSDGLFTNVEAR